MRERKFRVYSKLSKSYVEDETFFLTQDGSLFHWNRVDPDRQCLVGLPEVFVVEFSTGIKDKKGKEIYEGDIFQNDYDGGYDVVKWVERHAGFMLCYMGDEDESESLSLYKMDELEVVGNIHENPELLEEV